VWNLQYPDASTFQNMIFWQGSTAGPLAAPGTYTVRVTSGTDTPVSEKFLVKKDPQTRATNADLAEQLRFALQIRDRVTAANDAVKMIRSVKRQLDERAPAMGGTPGFGTQAKTFEDQLSVVEDSLYQTRNQSGEDPLNFPVRINNQMAALLGFVNGGERRPPAQSYEVYKVLEPQLAADLAKYKQVMDANLAKINAALKAAGQPIIVPTTTEPPAAARPNISSDAETGGGSTRRLF
jgi:hypothetical protein